MTRRRMLIVLIGANIQGSMSPALFADAPAGAFALTRLFDRAVLDGRLFGLRLEGVWMHVGTPEAVTAAEAALAATT